MDIRAASASPAARQAARQAVRVARQAVQTVISALIETIIKRNLYIVGDGNSQSLFNMKYVFFCKIGLTISGEGLKGDNLPTGRSRDPPSKKT